MGKVNPFTNPVFQIFFPAFVILKKPLFVFYQNHHIMSTIMHTLMVN